MVTNYHHFLGDIYHAYFLNGKAYKIKHLGILKQWISEVTSYPVQTDSDII